MAGFSDFIGSFRPSEMPLSAVLSRGSPDGRADETPEPRDDDEYVANLLSRGVKPGGAIAQAERDSAVADRLSEAESRLEVAERRVGHAEAARSRSTDMAVTLAYADASAELADARSELGDARHAARRHAEARRAQAEFVAGQSRDLDPLESAMSRARSTGHQVFAERTRAAMAAAGQRPRPFVSGEGEAGEVTAAGPEITRSGGGSCCGYCTEYGVSAPESAKLHAYMAGQR